MVVKRERERDMRCVCGMWRPLSKVLVFDVKWI